jgi:hypothetical protein
MFEPGKLPSLLEKLQRSHFILSVNKYPLYCHVPGGGVTNNSTWIRIGYRIYSLWSFTSSVGYNYSEHCSTCRFLNPADETALNRFRETLRGLTNFSVCLPYIAPGRPNGNNLPTVGCHATQQYRGGERIHGSIELAVA